MPKAIAYKTKSNWDKTHGAIQPIIHGLRKVGWDVEERESLRFPQGDEKEYDLGVGWGDTALVPDILASVGSRFKQVLSIDNGYIRRERWTGYYCLTWGGQRQCHEYLWQSPRCPERWLALNETIKLWRTGGDEILLLAPSIKQGKILGFDTHVWARKISDQIQKHTKKRVTVSIKRYHLNEPLREVLQRQSIAAVVGYNSKGMIEALLEGVPIFPLARCACEKMGVRDLSQIENPVYPDNRLEFFERLAGTQFLLSEVTEGIPFQVPFAR